MASKSQDDVMAPPLAPPDTGPVSLRHPFGEVCCEEEMTILRDHYHEFYFDHAPFNDQAMEQETYLIVGRRGCGKTSLTRFLTFQRKLKTCGCIDVDEPHVYENVLARVGAP